MFIKKWLEKHFAKNIIKKLNLSEIENENYYKQGIF